MNFIRKRIVKNVTSRSLAAVVGAAVMFNGYGPTLASAAAAPEYISDIYISYGADDEAAKKWLTDNGYTVIDQNMNENTQGGVSWLSWAGLSSEARSVYVGYKTTTNKDEAITDMRTMNMNSSAYSFEDYAKLLESQKAETSLFASNMKTALAEYRENYKEGKTGAKIAHDILNHYYDDDCDKAPLGDLLLVKTKEEMTEEEYNKEPKKHADLTTLLMQSNSVELKEALVGLFYAMDTAEDSWVSRLSDAGDFASISAKFEEEYSSVSESNRFKLITAEYDEDAKTLAENLVVLKGQMDVFKNEKLDINASESEINEYFKDRTDKNADSWASAAAIYSLMKNVEFDGTTIADFVYDDSYDFTVEEDRQVLYPILAAMSKGQRNLLTYVDFYTMAIVGQFDEKGMNNAYDEFKKKLKDDVAVSIYDGVDRSIFKPGGIALTSKARQYKEATGSDFVNQLLGHGLNYIPAVTLGASLVLLSVGIPMIKAGPASIAEINPKIVSMHDAATKRANNAIEQSFDMFENYTKLYDIKTITLKDGRVVPINYEELSFYDFSQQDLDKFSDYLEESGEKDLFEFYSNEYDLAKEEMDDITNNLQAKVNEMKQHMFRNKVLRYVGDVLCVAAALLSIATVVISYLEVRAYYNVEYTPIPRKMVSEASDEKGRSTYTFYDCVMCNRAEQGFGNDKLEHYGDLNGDVGKQWLALYVTKDKAAGEPITADILMQKKDTTPPIGKTPLSMFGYEDAVNIVDEEYNYNDGLGGLYMFYSSAPADAPAADKTVPTEKKDDQSSSKADDTSASNEVKSSASDADSTANANSGSVFGTGSLVLTGTLSAAAGALICFLITRKRKDK